MARGQAGLPSVCGLADLGIGLLLAGHVDGLSMRLCWSELDCAGLGCACGWAVLGFGLGMGLYLAGYRAGLGMEPTSAHGWAGNGSGQGPGLGVAGRWAGLISAGLQWACHGFCAHGAWLDMGTGWLG